MAMAVKAYDKIPGRRTQEVVGFKELSMARTKARKLVCVGWAASELSTFKPRGPEDMCEFCERMEKGLASKGALPD